MDVELANGSPAAPAGDVSVRVGFDGGSLEDTEVIRIIGWSDGSGGTFDPGPIELLPDVVRQFVFEARSDLAIDVGTKLVIANGRAALLAAQNRRSPQCVVVSLVGRNDGTRTELSALLTGWDYASHTTVGISANLDEEALLASTGLDSVDELEILAMADCLRLSNGSSPPSRCGGIAWLTADVSVQLPPGQVAGVVRLSAHLVLARTTPKREYRVAFLRGSRIDSSEPFTLRLEGDSGRFPTSLYASRN